MVAPITQHEWEALGEAEAGFAPEGEWEGEWENEYETGEQFLGAVGDYAQRGWNWLTTPESKQRAVALAAAKAAIPGAAALVGGRFLGGPGALLGTTVGEGIASLLPAKEWEAEFGGEGEGEWEGEFEVNPVRKVYLDAMLEHMAHEAAHAETEAEAVEGFLPLIPMLAGKLLPLAAKVLPKVAGKVIPRLARTVIRVSPQLSRGVSNITRTLYRNPGTRGLVRAVPSIAQRTMRRIVRQAATGRAVTPRSAGRLLAQQTYQVLSQPTAMARALRRHTSMDRGYHRSTGFAMTPAPRVVSGHCPTCGAAAMGGPATAQRWRCGCCACGCRG